MGTAEKASAVRARQARKKSFGRSAAETVQPTSRVEDAEQSGSGDEETEKCLRFVDVLTELPNGDAANATELKLNDRGFGQVESLESCRELRKLELHGSRLNDLGFLEMNHQLCWLGLARNRLSRIDHMRNLTALAVLDLSDNQLTRLDGLSGLTALKALIAARNKISSTEGLSPTRNPSLETLVLSHNKIPECKLAGFLNLRKLSLAHNQMHGFPSLSNLPELAELRLNGNRLSTISTDVSMLPKLAILDIGNNLVNKAESMQPLRGLRWMKNLNLLGNPVAGIMDREPLKGLLDSMQKLEIVNNRRLQSAPQKQKRKAWHTKAATQAAPKELSVHGGDFGGKRSVFADSDDDTPPSQNPRGDGSKQHPARDAKRPPPVSPSSNKTLAPEMKPTRKAKKRRRLEKTPEPAASAMHSSAAGSSVKRKGKKRKASQESAPSPSVPVARQKKKKKSRPGSAGVAS